MNEPFKTPKGYFENLPDEIQSRCLTKTENPKRTVYMRLASWAAILIPVLVMLFVFINRYTTPDICPDKYGCSLLDDITLMAETQGIDEDDIVEFIVGTGTVYGSLNTESQEEIADYLNSETDNYHDISELMNY